MGLLDDRKKSQYLQMAEEKLQGLLNLPMQAQRLITSPTAFLGLLGQNPLPRESGFAAGATGLPPTEMSVLDPNQAPYMQGYGQGEPVGYAGMALPFAAPAAVVTGRALAPKAGQALESYMVNQGLLATALPMEASRMSPFVQGVRAGDEMFIQHNLSPEKLYGANRLGGLPVPSLAISKVGNPMENFGDISLIGSKEMAIPSRGNPVFAADAYTVTKPNIYTALDKAGKEYVSKRFLEPFGKFADEMKSEIDQTNRNFLKNIEYSTLGKARYLYENKLLPNPNDFESGSKFRAAIRSKFDDVAYNNPEFTDNFYKWQDNIADDVVNAGGKIDYKIFKGYTNTGRERYQPATLENITKEMSGKTQGAEGNIPTSGALRGAITPKLKTQKDVLKSREKIVSQEDFEVVKENLNNKYQGLLGDIYSYLGTKNSGVDAPAFLQDVAMGTANRYEYSSNLYKQMPDELKNNIAAYAKELKAMPTEYFEVKPQRAVGLGEFKGALIPKDSPKKVKKILEDSGIREIYTYSSPEERKSLIKKFGKEMFVGIPAIPIGGGLLGSDEQ